jgi:hypothetical protein
VLDVRVNETVGTRLALLECDDVSPIFLTQTLQTRFIHLKLEWLKQGPGILEDALRGFMRDVQAF